MKNKDLFRLPIGYYELADSIYNYRLKVTNAADDLQRMYILEVKDFTLYGRVVLFEDIIVDEDGFKYKALSALSRVGGIAVHSDNCYNILRELHFVPRGSFADFVKKTTISEPAS